MHSPITLSTSAIQADIRAPNVASRLAALTRAECSPSTALVPDIIAAYAVESYSQCRIAALSALIRHELSGEQLERVIAAYAQHAEKPCGNGKVHEFFKAPELGALSYLVARQATSGELPPKAQELVAQNLSSDVYSATVGAWASMSGDFAEKHSAAICQALTQLASSHGGLETLTGGSQHPLIQALRKSAEFAKSNKAIANCLQEVVQGITEGRALHPRILSHIKPAIVFEAFSVYESLWGQLDSENLLKLAAAGSKDDRLVYAAMLGRELGKPDIARQVAALFSYNDQPTGICGDTHSGIKIPAELNAIGKAPIRAFGIAETDLHRADILRVIYALGLRGPELNDVVRDGLKSSSPQIKLLCLKILSGFILDGPTDTDWSKLPDFTERLVAVCLDQGLNLGVRTYALGLLPKASRKRVVSDHTKSYENLLVASANDERNLSSVLASIYHAHAYMPHERLAGIIQRQRQIFDSALNSSNSDIVRHATWAITNVLSGALAKYPAGTLGTLLSATREFMKPSLLTFELHRGSRRLLARIQAAAEYIRATKRAKEFRGLAKGFAVTLTALKQDPKWSNNTGMRQELERGVNKLGVFKFDQRN